QDTKFNQAKSPTKLFEYMACSKPTVSSRVGEARYIVRDGINGFLAGSQREFIEKMEALVEDENLCRRLGREARQDVERKYSLAVLGKQLSGILKETSLSS
ncbi:MAG: glycosyltransferase, partial [Candidatus Omnitrophota bacterium]